MRSLALKLAAISLLRSEGLVMPQRGRAPMTMQDSSLVGRRARVVVDGGAPRKVSKKQRRSRSSQLWPARLGSAACWLRLTPSQAFLAVENATVDGIVVDERDGVAVVSPRRAAPKAPNRDLPEGARLLNALRVGEAVNATVVRLLSPQIALVSCADVFREAKDSVKRPMRAILRCGNHPPVVGATLTTYVRLAEPNSGRLTLSVAPVDSAELKRARSMARIRRQIIRGSLKPGATRLATVVRVQNDGAALVDAGGLLATVRLPDHKLRSCAPGDHLSVKVLSLSVTTGTATLQHLDDDDSTDPPLDHPARDSSSSEL